MPALSLVRTVAVLVFATVAVLGPATAAVAQDACYPPPCTPGISDSTVEPGQAVSVTSGTASYEPGEPVEYGVQSTYQRLGQTTATASGAAIATFPMPRLAPGRHNVVFTSLRDGRQVRVPFTVSAPAPGAAAGPAASTSGDPAQKPAGAAAPAGVDGVAPVDPGSTIAPGRVDVLPRAAAPGERDRLLPIPELAARPGWALAVAAVVLGLVAWLITARRRRESVAGHAEDES